LHTRVLPATRSTADEDADGYADRIHTLMQDALTEMTANRFPLIG
jgi:hypothetical protein